MMSLDIVLLGPDGLPQQQVSIGIYLHEYLMRLVNDEQNSILKRLKDYYADAVIGYQEIDTLIHEAEAQKAETILTFQFLIV